MLKSRRVTWFVLLSAGLAAVAALTLVVWRDREQAGEVSYRNYERISVGMTREQVEALLGSAGEEVKTIPQFPAYIHPPDVPPGWTGVVWGDTFVRWQSGDRDIHIGFSEGRVTSKHYWEPSL